MVSRTAKVAAIEALTAELDRTEVTLDKIGGGSNPDPRVIYETDGSDRRDRRHVAHARGILARHTPEAVPTLAPGCGPYATCDHDECPVTGSIDFCSHCAFVLWDEFRDKLGDGVQPPDEVMWPCAEVRALCAAWGIEVPS